MILPTKHISTGYSLLGVGAILLGHLDRPRTITALWDRVRSVPEVANYERYVLSLDLLYAMGILELEDGLLRRGRQ